MPFTNIPIPSTGKTWNVPVSAPGLRSFFRAQEHRLSTFVAPCPPSHSLGSATDNPQVRHSSRSRTVYAVGRVDRSFGREIRKPGVGTCCVLPGPARTRFPSVLQEFLLVLSRSHASTTIMRVHETIETCGPGEQSILKSFVNRLELALSGWFGSHKSVRWP